MIISHFVTLIVLPSILLVQPTTTTAKTAVSFFKLSLNFEPAPPPWRLPKSTKTAKHSRPLFSEVCSAFVCV